MKKKKIIGNILIIIGTIPFIFTIGVSIYNAIEGLCLGFFSSCNNIYGLNAFTGTITIFAFMFWFIYLIALIFIIIGIVLKKKAKVKKDVR